jgi:hypothetical protein
VSTKPKSLSETQILARLRNARNPLEEAYKILGEIFPDSGPTEADEEKPTATERYKVTFVPRKGGRPQTTIQRLMTEEGLTEEQAVRAISDVLL